MNEFSEPWYVITEVDSWITDKFPGAIRIGRDKPPFVFSEDIVAVHPSLPEVGNRIVACVNAMAGIPSNRIIHARDELAALRKERDEALIRVASVDAVIEANLVAARQVLKERDEWRKCAERLHEEARSWIVQHGCDCNHPGCKVCRDVRISREALAEFDRLQSKSP